MLKTVKTYSRLAIVCALTVLPIGTLAGGTPEDVKAFKENKAKAEAEAKAAADRLYFWVEEKSVQEVEASGKPVSASKITPGAFVANAYLSGIGVDRDESEALLWYLRVRSQIGLNEDGFRDLIKSMPGQKIYAVKKRMSEELGKYLVKMKEDCVVDQIFKPVSDLKPFSGEFGNSFESSDPTNEAFIQVASWARSRKLILEEFVRSKGSDELLYSVVNYMEHLEFKPISAGVTFTREISDADKALFEASAELIKARILGLISVPSGAESSSLELVASAYEKGRFGLNVDPEQHKRWEGLARDARISEAKVRREEADSSGPELWLSVADQIKSASPEVKRILGDNSLWISRYLEVMTIKAEAGDLPSLDRLVAHYTKLVLEDKGVRTDSHAHHELIRWITARHKISKSPEDAMVLAHHFSAQNNRSLSMQMAEQYLRDLTSKAKKGSFSDILKVALLSDPNWFEKLEGGHSAGFSSFSPSEIRLLGTISGDEPYLDFGENGRLLKQFGKVGQRILDYMGESYATNPFGDPNFNATSMAAPETPRALFVKFVDAYVKSEDSSGYLLDPPHCHSEFVIVVNYLAEKDQHVADQYHEMKGLPRDYDFALRWHRILAVRGNYWSLMVIADSFERGRGVPRDLANAYAYYALAGNGPGGGWFPSDLSEAYSNTKGTNEQKLDACFKLTPSDKERALKIYKELASKFVDRLNRLAAKAGEEMAKREIQYARDYAVTKAAKTKPAKK